VLYLPMATPVAAQDVKTCSGNLAFCKKGVATFRRKIDFCVIVVNCAGQRKTRRDDRRGDKLDDVVTA
jgi:hypothetical protein